MPTESDVLYNHRYLVEEAEKLAQEQEFALEKAPLVPLEPILDSSRELLIHVYKVLARDAKQRRQLSSAGEWLIDNFYILQEQIAQLSEDLPREYYNKLPRLTAGEYQGFPRMYELVQMAATLNDNIINQEITAFAVQAYQRHRTLKLGELWAIPILIRLALIVRLSKRSEEVLKNRRIQDEIEDKLGGLMGDEEREPGTLLLRITELMEEEDDNEKKLTILAKYLRSAGALSQKEREWLNYKFQKWNTNVEDRLQSYTQELSKLHLSIQNAISTLREVTESDWQDFVEANSVVERILRLDPSGYYSEMDFKSRDRYRKKIEKFSAHSSYTEQEVAERVLLFAEQADQQSEDAADNAKEKHVGFYIEGEGYQKLTNSLQYDMPIDEQMLRWTERHPSIYFSAILLHLAVLLGMVAFVTGFFRAPDWLTVVTLITAFLPALELSVVSTNRLITLMVPPRLLPKLEFKQEIPDRYRTLVVVPTLLTSTEDARNKFEALEIRSLSNPDPGLQFALLSDFTDADEEHLPVDNKILNTAHEEAQRLNRKYRSRYGDKFLLLHRKRCWNEKQHKWMGWERKRGKLEELNRLLQNPDAHSTYTTVPDSLLESHKQHPVIYVITLDDDTQLPPGSARELIGTAAHPLNRAEIDSDNRRGKRGYAIFQPRISISPESANATFFSKIFSGNVGIDPYTTAVSDVYQDLFGEGIYTGKGLYDVKAFHTVLGERFPDNRILSHDLLESTYLQTALVTDIEFFDDYPTTYMNYTKRLHRWIRGDWQLLHWMLPRVPSGSADEREKNAMNPLSVWKIFDNMRRSLNPIAILILLLLGWILLPGSPLVWTAAALGITAFPIYSSFTTAIFQRPPRVKWKLYLEKVRTDLRLNTYQAASVLLWMPHQAYITMDAIIRTLWRLFISRERLLEWTTASQTERETKNRLWFYLYKMWFQYLWSVFCLTLSWLYHPGVLPLVIPFAVVWIGAPVYAYRASLIGEEDKGRLGAADVKKLRVYARRTWQYFERYVGKEHSWLPPDNFQEDPFIGLVGRTSPTNMGLTLVATCTAYEFGYISLSEMLDRLGNTLGSMKLLDRHNGHFYNWYSTKLGEVLSPRYVSTVDSGNLAASLMVVKQALLILPDSEWLRDEFMEGLRDTLNVLDEISEELLNDEELQELHDRLDQLLDRLFQMLPSESPETPDDWKRLMTRMRDPAKKLKKLDLDVARHRWSDIVFEDLKKWLAQPESQIENLLEEIEKYLSHSEAYTEQNPFSQRTISDLSEVESFAGLTGRITELADWCEQMMMEMDFSILYKEERRLFSIGYNIDRASQDKGTYDLLASEARLASYMAIAKGDVSPEHWFRLSRRLTSLQKNEILLSWGGTMFEYLMPVLFTKEIDGTLLQNTYEHAVQWQVNYGKRRNRPWGFSESGYGVLNIHLHYQYRAFGAPGLGLRRGLAEDYVVAPYASMLALMIDPRKGLSNLERLKQEGAYGINGFYESIDYKHTRSESDVGGNVIKMYMVHHQAMSLLALANVIRNNLIQSLFHRDPLVQSCELLLQEKIPRGIPVKEPRLIDVELEPGEEESRELYVEHAGQGALNEPVPRTHLLSNGTYSTVITHSGTGYSFSEGKNMTRWRADPIEDSHGVFFYIRDLDSGKFWSNTHQPTAKAADRYDSWFHYGKIQTARVDQWIESFTEVCVSPEDNIELRKITLTNYAQKQRRIELTSYAKVVLNDHEADLDHPAFSNLFIQTEYLPEFHALIAKRRPRGEEKPIWLVHTIATDGTEWESETAQYETDRNKFIGRGRTLKNPVAMDPYNQLSGSTGNVPDPILSLRRIVTLEPGEKCQITFGLGKAESREEALRMADVYDNPYVTNRAFELASIYSQVELDHTDLSGKQYQYFEKLAGLCIYQSNLERADESRLRRNRMQQSGLWAHGISGDLPIVLYRIKDAEYIPTVALLLKGHYLWRLNGLGLDLVIVNEDPSSYLDELHDALEQQITSSMEHRKLTQKGDIYLLKADQIPPDNLLLLESVAHVVIEDDLPDLQYDNIPSKAGGGSDEESQYVPVDLARIKTIQKQNDRHLLFDNGYGGFTRDGKEYVIRLSAEEDDKYLHFPPAPWINVVANNTFGFITTEKGSDHTWSQNSHENRLTPWSNDAVMDPPGEVIYLQDNELGYFWTPTPGPVPGTKLYEVRYGFGYARYISQVMNIQQEVTKWVPLDDPVKIVRLKLHNTDLMPKRLTVFRYIDWVLGNQRERASRFTLTDLDREHRAIYARNHYNNEFAGRTAFAAYHTEVPIEEESYTADRAAFIGRNGSLENPQALKTAYPLDERFGTRFDACAVFKMEIRLEPGEIAVIDLLLGETETEHSAQELIQKYQNSKEIESSFEEAIEFWRSKLETIQIDTPSEALNILFNGWLQYQNIVSRLYARTAFYQSGGAYGYRDQLQDASAVLYLDPDRAREQILLHAAHQFEEGDVLHWWHPPTGRGIRSRISDDLLWLPYVTAFYINRTGDLNILDEQIEFITARKLEEDEPEAYLSPEPSGVDATLYEHCCRAIDCSLTKGPHGLPLIGTGDWNDGMNRVGEAGIGESVWLGFFLYSILEEFVPLANNRDDQQRVESYRSYQKGLEEHLNEEGWDGLWYRRAYYDDGTPLGSKENEECKIDAIAQAWSVLSGAATKQKAKKALESADRFLVDESDRIIRLLTPAFDKTDKNPGYIKGYIPGVRENGGQYTHGALWLIKAFAETGCGKRATELLEMLIPVNHARTREEAERYKVEPYAVAADIYGEPPLTGMGGWTWYTGSAGWMYRIILESILGLKLFKGSSMTFDPHISPDWKSYSIRLRDRSGSVYEITVKNPDGLEGGSVSGTLDGQPLERVNGSVRINMKEDGKTHRVELKIG